MLGIMKHLFLDFDGVVSPYAPYMQKVTACTSIGGFDISYLEEVVEWINSLVNDPEWNVYWLTTWVKKIHHLSVIGISDDIHVIKPVEYVNPKKGLLWKPKAGLAQYDEIMKNDPDDIVVWIDDDPRICKHDKKNLYWYAPQENTGITQRMMDEINAL